MPRTAGPLLLLAALTALNGAEPGSATSPYTFAAKTRDGIGTRYLGREIASYMSHVAAPWLDRPEREHEERPGEVIAALGLKPDQVVVDFGCGTGYYALRIAPLVKTVIGVDIQQEMLDLLNAKASKLGVTNVVPVHCTPTDPRLTPATVDLILLVDVYHELAHPVEVMSALKSSLRRNGRIALVEFKGEDPDVPIKPLHKMTERQARLEMASFGFTWHSTLSSLPWQHLMIFGLPQAGANNPP